MKKNITLKVLVVLIAIFLWILQLLFREQTSKIDVPVRFTNIPQNLVISEDEQDVSVTLSARGLDILILKIISCHFEVDASDFRFGKNPLNVSAENLICSANVKYKIGHIQKPEFIDIDKVIIKYIPIEINYASSKDQEFFLQNKITNKMQKVKTKGPSSLFEKIDKIETEGLSRKFLVDNKIKISLISPHKELQLMENFVVFEITQIRIITKTISLIPVKYPLNLNIAIIPQKVSAMIQGPENIVKKVTNKNITARLDHTKIRKGFSKVHFELPTGVKLLEYTPQNIQIINN